MTQVTVTLDLGTANSDEFRPFGIRCWDPVCFLVRRLAGRRPDFCFTSPPQLSGLYFEMCLCREFRLFCVLLVHFWGLISGLQILKDLKATISICYCGLCGPSWYMPGCWRLPEEAKDCFYPIETPGPLPSILLYIHVFSDLSSVLRDALHFRLLATLRQWNCWMCLMSVLENTHIIRQVTTGLEKIYWKTWQMVLECLGHRAPEALVA